MPLLNIVNETQTSPDQKVNCKRKICPIILLLIGGILIGGLGFLLGKSTNCNSPVLGIQSDSLGTRLLALLRFDLEKPSDEASQLQIQQDTGQYLNIAMSPSPETIIIKKSDASPIPSPTDDGNMYWGGSRNGKQSPLPSTTSDYDTKETERLEGDNTKHRSTPDPTPKYYYDWDRSKPGKKVDAEKIQQIIDISGIKLEKPAITKTDDQNQITVTGSVKDQIFGFLPITLPIEIVVDSDNGEVAQIQVPWWRTIFGNYNFGGVSQIRCGDGVCTTSKENQTNCSYDCTGAVCGNAICEYGEGINNCSADCINVGIPESSIAP